MTDRKVLGIDTSTRWLNLAVLDAEGRVLAEIHEQVPTHATKLVAGLEALLPPESHERRALAAVGVVLGPGSFTGLRVGLAAAEGITASMGLPVFGLDSLSALARCSSGEGEGMALLDARRNQVYAARFSRRGGTAEALGEPGALSPASLVDVAARCAWAIGDGVSLVEGWPASCLLEGAVPNLAVPAAREALVALDHGRPPDRLTPLYVRPPDVKEPETRGT